MKFFVLFMVLFIGFSIIATENAFAEKCLPIELEYSIVGGNVTELCKSDTNISVTAKIHASDKGKIIIEIPQKVVYSLSLPNCGLGELVVLMNGQEILPDNTISDNTKNIITVSFQAGNHTIAFVGLTILPDPGPSDYCGIVMGYDSLYLPPKFQEKKEVSLKHIRCNDGLVVLAKYDGSPACVKYSTGVKLLERGWGMCSDELNYDRGNPCGPRSSPVIVYEPNARTGPEGECLDITTIRTVSMLNIQIPANLPQNFTLHCGWADLYEAELLYAGGIPVSPLTRSDIPAKTQDGAIHIIVTDLKSKVGDVDYQKEIGNVDDQIIKEFESVKKVNPSLNSQLVDINGKKAITYEPCKNCGKQTATFEDDSVINNSFGVPARIMFYDDTGKRYFLESNRPLSELIEVAKSLQS